METFTTTEAIREFERMTGAADGMAARAYLPDAAPADCPQCVTGEGHGHDLRETYTLEEITEAAGEFMTDEYNRELDRQVWRSLDQ